MESRFLRPGRLLVVVALVALAINSTILGLSIRAFVETGDDVSRYARTRERIDALAIQLLNAETGQRGYIITGEKAYLAPYQDALDQIDANMDFLEATLGSGPLDARVKRLGLTVAAKVAHMAKTIRVRDEQGAAPAAAAIKADTGKLLMDSLRSLMGELSDVQRAGLEQSTKDYLAARLAAIIATVAFVIGTSVLIACAYLLPRRALRDKTTALADLARSSGVLAEHVDHLKKLHEASSYFQSCQTLDEVAECAPQMLGELLNGFHGAIYVHAASRNALELLCQWGNVAGPGPIGPNDCWSLRRGQVYVREGHSHRPGCHHAPVAGADTVTVCVPMLAQGEAVGLMSLVARPETSPERANDMETFADMVANHLGLAIANIKLRETLNDQSLKDPLTGLFNRRYFDIVGDREMKKARRTGQPLTLVMCDIDHFKRFNDLNGHLAGDVALMAVSGFLKSSLRDEDWAFRFGGEEFLLLLPNTDADAAFALMDRIRDDIHRLPLDQNGRGLPSVTMSAGICTIGPDHASLAEAIEIADAALYRAKSGGRNRVELPKPLAA